MLFCVHGFIGVKCLVRVQGLSRLTSWSVDALCLEITRPFEECVITHKHKHTHTYIVMGPCVSTIIST